MAALAVCEGGLRHLWSGLTDCVSNIEAIPHLDAALRPSDGNTGLA